VKNPSNAQEWQEAVDAAEFYLALESAKMYGLVTGGPKVNLERCEEILKRGKTLGYRPAPFDALCAKFIPALNCTPNAPPRSTPDRP